ncbi:hypothetical protein OHA61_39215 [Streptomyces sp. NBC_00885]|uniref:hypothetical protein n=1 Tax=Streptomyces sp. NBC_00885 TaxID=2975857 RepID=UPI00386E0295|nr:hypothetical protein OHA61_39215 [Streptomyces sp. NBC_00885]
MDHFEWRLAQMMRDTQEPASFEPKHRERLQAGISARRRTRTAQRAAGSALAVAGLAVGLLLLPHASGRVEPSGPRPQPATSPSPSAPDATPEVSPSAPSSSATSTAPALPDLTNPATPPADTGSSTATSGTPSGSAVTTPPFSTPPPPSGTATTQSPPPPGSG